MENKGYAILIGPAHPYRGGIASCNEQLARQLVKQGLRVEMYNFTLQYPDFLFPGVTQYATEAGPTDLEIFRKINSVNPFNWIKIGLEIKKKKPNFIVISFWTPLMSPCFGTILRIVKTNKFTKIISFTHNVVPHESRWVDKLFTKYFTNVVDGFISMSQEVQKQLNNFVEHKPIILTPHPIFNHFGDKLFKNEAVEYLDLDDKFSYILFFGFIRDYKGLDWLLEAFALVKDRLPRVKLLIAGEYYTDKKLYLELIQGLNLQDQVILRTDFIPDSQVKYYFSASDLLALPYKSATQSGVTQIGFHFEIPMLVTSVGGLPEMIRHGENGIVVQPNVSSIADGIIEFFEQTNVSEIRKGIAVDKKKYSWEVMKDKVIDLAEKLTHQKIKGIA